MEERAKAEEKMGRGMGGKRQKGEEDAVEERDTTRTRELSEEAVEKKVEDM